ncbi:HYR domain-containing protein [Pyxidicoccus sp. 3LG]
MLALLPALLLTLGPPPLSGASTTALTLAPAQKVRPFSDVSGPKDLKVTELTGLEGFALFFDGERGLYRTDGTAEGTQPVRDLEPRLMDEEEAPRIAVLGGRAYWSHRQARTTRYSIWTSDGTPVGTRPLEGLEFAERPTPPIVFNGALYFSVGKRLYRSDGTAPGTQALADMGIEVIEGNPAGASRVVGNRLFFRCRLSDASWGTRLCVTDGTAAGTLIGIELAPAASIERPPLLGVLGGRVLTAVMSSRERSRLVLTDGTDAGTTFLLDAAPYEGFTARPTWSSVMLGGSAYLPCYTQATGHELCRTDGTAEGSQVLDLLPGADSTGPQLPSVMGTRLVFEACSLQAGCEPWTSDGTTAGSAMLRDLYPGNESSLFETRFVPFSNALYFAARSSRDSGSMLWKTDGTAAGTVRVKALPVPTNPVVAGEMWLNVAAAVRLGNALVFPGNDRVHGTELWKTDGTAAGTVPVDPATPTSSEGMAAEMLYFDDWLLMGTRIGLGSDDLWSSNGTAAGTRMLRANTVWQGAPLGMAIVGNRVLFHGDNPEALELWATDGSPAGTVPLKPMPRLPGLLGVSSPIMSLGEHAFFTGYANAPERVSVLWRTDGTPAGTQWVDSPRLERPSELGISNGHAWLTSNGFWLVRSDGTPEGTVTLAEFTAGDREGLAPRGFTALGGLTLFSAPDAETGRELWKSDGTPQGTVRVADLVSGTFGSNPQGFHVWRDVALFWAGPPPQSLWRTDGTAGGTRKVSSAVVAWQGSKFVTWGDQVFFAGQDASGDVELWRTDGTETGTVRVMDIYPGAESSAPDSLTLVSPSGPLLFAAEEPVDGRELWRLDSPTGQPSRATDLAPGPASSRPSLLTVTGPSLYFSADDGAGPALFKLQGLAPDTRPPRLTCPEDMPVVVAHGSGAFVTYSPVNLRDDSGGLPVLDSTHPSGSAFPRGTTRVTLSATDDSGNRSEECSFNITVAVLLPDGGVPPPPVDGGAPADGGVPPDAGSGDGSDAGTSPGDGDSSEGGGCGCQAGAASMPWSLALLGLLVRAIRPRRGGVTTRRE